MLYYVNEKNNGFCDREASIRKAINFFKNNFSLAVHNKNCLTGYLADILKDDIMVELKKRNTYNNGIINIGLITEKISSVHNSQIIACFISKIYLEKLISAYPNSDIIYLPWTEEEQNWVLNNKNFSKI